MKLNETAPAHDQAAGRHVCMAQAAARLAPSGLGFRWTAQQLASSTVAIPKAVGAGVPLGDSPRLLVLSIRTPPACRPGDLADLRLLLTPAYASMVIAATAVLMSAILIHATTPLLGARG